MASRFDETRPDEVVGLRMRPASRTARSRPGWDLDTLHSDLLPRFVDTGAMRFGLTREESEEAAHLAFLLVAGQVGRLDDPLPFVQAAFLNECRNLVEARRLRRERAADAGLEGR